MICIARKTFFLQTEIRSKYGYGYANYQRYKYTCYIGVISFRFGCAAIAEAI